MVKSGAIVGGCFSKNSIRNHRPIQHHYSRELVQHLYESPFEFQAHICHVYGLDVQKKDGYYITLANNALKYLDVSFNGAFMVDVFPILKHVPRWMPIAGFQTIGEAAKPKRDLRLLVEVPYSQTRKLVAEGRAEFIGLYVAE